MSSKDKADRNRSYGLQSPRSATLHKYNRDSNNADVGQPAPANPASLHLQECSIKNKVNDMQ